MTNEWLTIVPDCIRHRASTVIVSATKPLCLRIYGLPLLAETGGEFVAANYGYKGNPFEIVVTPSMTLSSKSNSLDTSWGELFDRVIVMIIGYAAANGVVAVLNLSTFEEAIIFTATWMAIALSVVGLKITPFTRKAHKISEELEKYESLWF